MRQHRKSGNSGPPFNTNDYCCGILLQMERFLTNEDTMVATVFAPIIFAPASVMVFKETPQGMSTLTLVLANLLGITK